MFHAKQLGCPNMTTLRGRRPPSVTERLFASFLSETLCLRLLRQKWYLDIVISG